MSDITYVHYGHKTFNKDLFQPIKNEIRFSKPEGGLWASAINDIFSRKKWCEEENFRDCSEEDSFRFQLKDEKILMIDNFGALERMECLYPQYLLSAQEGTYDTWKQYYLNFEALSKIYDAVYVKISNDQRLYWALYGWDCDSILIMNPNKIHIL